MLSTSFSSQIYSSPARYPIAEETTLLSIIDYWYKKRPDKTIFRKHVNNNWVNVSNKEFVAEITGITKGLQKIGVQPKERVGIICTTRFEWSLLDYSIMLAEAISVPIYPTSSVSQIEWIVADSGMKVCFVETQQQAISLSKEKNLQGCKFIAIESGEYDNLKELINQGNDTALNTADIWNNAINSIKADHIATIVYTSGTSGKPKGCCLSHKNFLSEGRHALNSTFGYIMLDGEACTLMFLPMSHVLARALVYASIESGTIVGHTNNTLDIVNTLKSFQPTFIIAVPRVFEKIYSTLNSKATGKAKAKLFKTAVETATNYDKLLKNGETVPKTLKRKHQLFDKLIFSSIRKAVGNKCRAILLGGAPMSSELVHFFNGVGLKLYEGYGLTEATACVTLNTIDATKVGTCGKIFDGNKMQLAEDGEILLQGDNIFKEYWNNPVATQEAFQDGWFKTGDLGSIDSDGYLTITGRKKDIIITAGGKNVAPAGLEEIINQHILVSQSVVLGDKKPFVSALITVDPLGFEKWKREKGHKADIQVSDLVNDSELVQEIQQAVDLANKSVSRAESIKKFTILENELSEDKDELTPSLKIKRHVVNKRYADIIEEMYRKPKA